MSVMDNGGPANPDQPDLMGYATPDALAQAKRASDVEAKRLHDENIQLRELLTQRDQPAPRQEIPNRQRPEDRLSELGIPLDALNEYVNNTVLQPIVQMVQGQANARNHMLASYGQDYVKFEQDVAQHIRTDPALERRYQQMWQTDPIAATEYAFLKFGENRRKAHPELPPEDNGVQRAQQSQAGIPTSRAGEARQQDFGPNDRVNRAFAEYQANPNKFTAEAYARARLSTVIRQEFLDGTPG